MRGICSTSQLSPSVLCSNYRRLSHLGLGISSTTKAKVPLRAPLIRCTNLTDGNFDAAIKPLTRRSADYGTSYWDNEFLGSLPTEDFTMKKHGEQRETMIVEVKDMLEDSSMDALTRLELVDAIERFSLQRHFQQQIKTLVEMVYHYDDKSMYPEDLYATALRFRVLRQQGYAIPEGIFKKFKDESGKFCKVHSDDIKGLLSLYEASFLEWTGDTTLEEARAFATQHLKLQLDNLEPKMGKEVQQALDMPLHRRFPTLKARWSIEAYDDGRLHPTLMGLAKLDYNLLQNAYKEEIKRLARWWTDLDLLKKVPYTRDRLLEHYLWILGMVIEPQFKHCREMETKVVHLISALDDTYDVYGTVEELEIFTHLIDRWEISGIERLPEPMRWCFLAIYNTSNEIADWTFKEKRFNILPYLSNAWARLCKLYLQEAKWYNEGHKPTLREYLPHASISIAHHLMMLVLYFLTTPTITKEGLDYIDSIPDLLSHSGVICRLLNDLGTSSHELARGDTIKALQCYMNETGALEEVAREYINGLINEVWKKMNGEYYAHPPQYPHTISEPYLSGYLNLARTSQFFYGLNKDQHGKPDEETVDHLKRLLINPI